MTMAPIPLRDKGTAGTQDANALPPGMPLPVLRYGLGCLVPPAGLLLCRERRGGGFGHHLPSCVVKGYQCLGRLREWGGGVALWARQHWWVVPSMCTPMPSPYASCSAGFEGV